MGARRGSEGRRGGRSAATADAVLKGLFVIGAIGIAIPALGIGLPSLFDSGRAPAGDGLPLVDPVVVSATPATPSATVSATAWPDGAEALFASTGPAEDCVIKGNISVDTGEKIYHVPGQEYYDETVIREDHGERWFCTEEEAIAAGWRKSYV